MTIADAYGPGRFGLSFELFPPKTAEALAQPRAPRRRAGQVQPQLHHLHLRGGRLDAGPHARGHRRRPPAAQLPVATHLTCVGRTPPSFATYLTRARRTGRRKRGRPPRRPAQGETAFKPVDGRLSLRQRAGGVHPQRVSAAGHRRGRLSGDAPGSRRAPRPTSRTSSARSTPAPTSSSRSCSTTTTTSSASATAARELGIDVADRAGAVAGDEPRADPADHVAVRREAAAGVSRGAGTSTRTTPTASSRPASSSPPARPPS